MAELDKNNRQSKDSPSPTRKRLLIAASLAIGFLVLEAVSYGFLAGFIQEQRYKFFHYDYANYVERIPDSFFAKFKPNFDPVLGWNSVPGKQLGPQRNCAGGRWTHGFDSLGSRNNPYPAEDVLISLYGGSYTLSQEVNDDQTWQFFVSQATGSKVLNFGVGGYGADQAYLKLKRNVERGLKTPIVVLGLYSAGIHRVVNAFRPYYGFGTGLKLGFKPILLERGGSFIWEDVPIDSLDDRGAVADAALAVRDYDYWFHYNNVKPKISFPFSFAALYTAYFVAKYHVPRRNFWEGVPRASRATEEIVRRFVALSKQESFTPVIAFLPESGELQYYRDGAPAKYANFKQRVRETYSPSKLTIVDVYDEEFDPEQFMTRPGCHPSEYGNRVIADAVYRAIAGRVLELKSR